MTRARIARRGVLGGVLASSTARASCSRVADLPLRLVDGYPLVPATLSGVPVSFLVDTGAQGLLIEPSIATTLRLPLRGMTRIFGTGGSQDAPLVLLPGLRLGDAAMPAQLAPVAALPIKLDVDPPLAGLLGASLLSRFDVELDVLAGRFALTLPGECPAPAGLSLPMQLSRHGEALVPVRVNGTRLLALVDTGVRATLLGTEAAGRLGLAVPGSANTALGIDGQRLPIGHLRVRLALGDGPEADAPISVTPVQIDGGDMMLGLDQLRQQRVWLGYAARRLILGPRPTP